MADEADKATESAEKAYAAAAAGDLPDKAPPKARAPEASEQVKPDTAVKVADIKPARKDVTMTETAKKADEAKPVAKKATAGKTATQPKAKPAAKTVADKATPKKSAPKKVVAKKKPAPAPKKPTAKAKEPIMAKTPDFSKTVTDAMSEVQTRAKDAYEKSTEMVGEASEFTKGNVEALVESGKILSEGMQELGKTYAEEAKSAFETATTDMKEMAAVKSPTELFQLQGKLMRRNFDSLVAMSSKSSEAMIKLANDTMAPLSGRMTLAADKISKAS